VDDLQQALAALPRIDLLVEQAGTLVARYGRPATTEALRAAVDQARQAIKGGAQAPQTAALIEAAAVELTARFPGPPAEVINAAGIVIHTNLGRAPLSDAAARAMVAAAGYCDVEFDLQTGRRGGRSARLEPLIAALTGAEAGIAVNNGAAALVLALATLAGGRQVLVSRGELVEIGGAFRLPDVMAAAGVQLVEVGTTNRTRVEDYAAGDDVGLVLKVHPSNYRLSGFVSAPSVSELADLARKRGIPLVHDIGSGLLAPSGLPVLRDEPDATTSLDHGADLVVCSGDKLLGGPQAGLLLGRADLVRRCATNPLARALRIDKLRLAALTATLEQHLRGELTAVPVWAALTADEQHLRGRVTALATAVGATVIDGRTMIGGGSAPEEGLPTPVARLESDAPDALAAALLHGSPPIIVRVSDHAVLVDLRTVPAAHDALVIQRLVELVR
jgi:L-seryl-tRNA(Ser) seleniumtransferase